MVLGLNNPYPIGTGSNAGLEKRAWTWTASPSTLMGSQLPSWPAHKSWHCWNSQLWWTDIPLPVSRAGTGKLSDIKATWAGKRGVDVSMWISLSAYTAHVQGEEFHPVKLPAASWLFPWLQDFLYCGLYFGPSLLVMLLLVLRHIILSL